MIKERGFHTIRRKIYRKIPLSLSFLSLSSPPTNRPSLRRRRRERKRRRRRIPRRSIRERRERVFLRERDFDVWVTAYAERARRERGEIGTREREKRKLWREEHLCFDCELNSCDLSYF